MKRLTGGLLGSWLMAGAAGIFVVAQDHPAQTNPAPAQTVLPQAPPPAGQRAKSKKSSYRKKRRAKTLIKKAEPVKTVSPVASKEPLPRTPLTPFSPSNP